VSVLYRRDPAAIEPGNAFVQALAAAVADGRPTERISVGRDGASDAISFLQAGIPAVEFGPVGGGHHGPGEWVSIASLERYRRVLVSFATLTSARLGGGNLRLA
jgi:succinyl-diaminopimelate desuccinylase